MDILLLAMPGGWELIVILLFIVFPLILMLAALIDAIRSEYENDTNKIIWILVILLFPFLGSILYFIMAGSQKKRE